MRRFFIVLFFPLLSLSSAFAQREVYDEFLNSQLKAMENGPWEFNPEGYYYSRYTKTIKVKIIGAELFRFKKKNFPGLGVHDKGPAGTGIGGDGYVSKYSPNAVIRTAILKAHIDHKNKLEEMRSYIESVSKSEAISATDRKIDISIRIFQDKINRMINKVRLNNIVLLKELPRKTLALEIEAKLSAIEDNLKIIKESYELNSTRSTMYIKEIEKLSKLLSLQQSAFLSYHQLKPILNN